MKSIGDRRAAVRLEIVGTLWGTVQLAESARVLNISPGGALIMAPSGMPLDSTASVRLTLGGEHVTLHARVRHLRHVPAAGREPAHYLIGLELPEMPLAIAQALE
jgi:hypothetical protein